MISKRLLTAAVVVLLLSLGLAVQAQQCVADYQWSVDNGEWDCSKNDVHQGVPILIYDWEWQEGWPTDSLSYRHLIYGEAPSPDDPDVEQTIKNRTTSRWTDWHVEIVGGEITSATVNKVNADGTTGGSWDVYLEQNGQGICNGFYSEVPFLTAQTNGVYQSDFLHVFFSFNVLPGASNVQIYQYPTTTAIPEPGSMLALLGGLGAFGVALRKRVK